MYNIIRIIQKRSNTSLFSSIKNSLQKIKSNSYETIKDLYEDLTKYEEKLDYPSSLKYAKYLEDFNKKIKKMNKKHLEETSDHAQKEESEKQWWAHSDTIYFNQTLTNTKTHQYFYRLMNQSYKPYQNSYKTRKLPLSQLYKLIHTNNHKNLDYFYQKIIRQPMSNLGMISAVKERYEYLQHFLCMICFEGYKQFYCKSLEMEQYESQSALQRLYNNEGKFQKDFKFMPHQMTHFQLQTVLEIGANLIKYNFASQRVPLFSQKIFLSDQMLSKFTVSSLRNNLYILGYCQTPVLHIDAKLMNFFDLISEKYNSHTDQQWWPYQTLFYLLANQLQIYTLIAEISQIPVSMSWLENLPLVDKQIMYLMIKILSVKYGLELKSTQGQKLRLLFENYFQPADLESETAKNFVIFLNKHHYPYLLDTEPKISDDHLFRMQEKSFLCMGMDKFLNNFNQGKNKSTPNGKGRLILEYFNVKKDSIKIINMEKALGLKKFTKKEEYFKSKMKGVKPLKVPRVKKYQF